MLQRLALVIDANRNAPADEVAGMILTEMREPTAWMARAGAKTPDFGPLRPGSADCDVNAILPSPDAGKPNPNMTYYRYQAMIDEAISGKLQAERNFEPLK